MLFLDISQRQMSMNLWWVYLKVMHLGQAFINVHTEALLSGFGPRTLSIGLTALCLKSQLNTNIVRLKTSSSCWANVMFWESQVVQHCACETSFLLVHEILTEVRQDSSVGRGTYCQAWWSEFDPGRTRAESQELTSDLSMHAHCLSLPSPYPSVGACMHVRLTHRHAHAYKLKCIF